MQLRIRHDRGNGCIGRQLRRDLVIEDRTKKHQRTSTQERSSRHRRDPKRLSVGVAGESHCRFAFTRIGTPLDGPMVTLRRFGTTGFDSTNSSSNRFFSLMRSMLSFSSIFSSDTLLAASSSWALTNWRVKKLPAHYLKKITRRNFAKFKLNIWI